MLEATLSPAIRLALAYAPRSVQPVHLALFALDARLAGIVSNAREPMLAQLKLAWWRDRLSPASADWPSGEPLLDCLSNWNSERVLLIDLVDGWEALLFGQPNGTDAVSAFAEARGAALAALARQVGASVAEQSASKVGRLWGLADLCTEASIPVHLDAVLSLVSEPEPAPVRFPKSLRPLAIIDLLAKRAIERKSPVDIRSPIDLLAAIRIGLLGR